MTTTIPKSTVAQLTEIPSETTVAERLLLYGYFQRDWAGTGTVVEIGPFLGGTTRAIALGMLNNPRFDGTAVLRTFDRFGEYYEPQRLRKSLEPLVASGAFTAPAMDSLCAGGQFLDVFTAIHEPHEYYRLVRPHASPLPDLPEEIEGSNSLHELADDNDLSALFIDGCKSWAGTHYAMQYLLPRIRPNAPIIFQDYGWYTCFWLGAFAFALKDLLELKWHVDATYTFRLKAPVTAEEVSRRFARTPTEMGEKFFRDACLWGMRDAIARRDARAALVAQLHLVAALATIGRQAEAAAVLAKVDPKTYGPLGYMVERSRKSPTYLPGNRPILWAS